MGHCQTNAVRINELDAAEERGMLKATLERIGKATGKKPVGWLGAGLAETWNTLDYLIDEGVRYIADWTADDLPFRMNVGGKTIMSIPYSLQINDATQFYNQKSTPEDFEKIVKAQFDCLYARKRAARRASWRSRCIRSSRARPTGTARSTARFEYITSKPGVWLATGSEIIDHLRASRCPMR